MRDVLAERLLAAVMKWMPEDVASERPILEALATFRYDEYQQFSPGMRFIESLALWLNQFNSDDERRCAYRFVRDRLIFISSREMAHLVSVAFPDFIRPFLIRQTAIRLSTTERFVTKIANLLEFKVLLRQSLFLGLSDGAHIDLFRRSNPEEIGHEQVWQTYEVSDEKAEDMLSKLNADLEMLLERKLTDVEKKFQMVFLLDDFSGSGLSYLRKERSGSEYGGKIHKVLRKIYLEDSLNHLVNTDDLQVCIVLHVATEHALSYLQESIRRWLQENNINNQCTVLAVQTLPDTIELHYDKDAEFIELSKKYFDLSIIDEHYRKGKHEEPHLGFDQCALPLVLSHNTPNNSIPLLWSYEDGKYRGLFPRVSRHRGEV